MTPIIKRFVIKLLSKDQGSGITKLPGQMQAGFQESMVTEKLIRKGYDPRTIKSETELKMILNRIDASATQSKEQKEKAMKQLATIMDMKGRKIKPGARIMGGEEVVETEAEILERLKRGNKETVEKIKQRKFDEALKAEQDKMLKDEDYIPDIIDPDDFAQGGRAGFMAGGMGRRAFLKMMAAGGAGIAGLKTGLINLFKPRSQAVEQVVETVTKTDAFGVPEHFAPLVNKIMKEGKLVKESDRIQTYKHPTRKDIDLDYEMDTGSVGVRFETDQGMKADYYLKKSPPDEGAPRGGIDEFYEGEIKYKMGDGDTYYKGFEEGIDTGTSNLDDFVGMPKKSASGAKVKLPESVDDYASGGIARMLGE
jgi:hypothetical protein